MNLLDQPREQVKDLAVWMRRVGELETPSPAMWAEIKQGLNERALFVDSYIVDKIAIVPRHLFEGKTKSFVDDLNNAALTTIDPEPIPFLQRNGEQPAPAPRT